MWDGNWQLKIVIYGRAHAQNEIFIISPIHHHRVSLFSSSPTHFLRYSHTLPHTNRAATVTPFLSPIPQQHMPLPSFSSFSSPHHNISPFKARSHNSYLWAWIDFLDISQPREHILFTLPFTHTHFQKKKKKDEIQQQQYSEHKGEQSMPFKILISWIQMYNKKNLNPLLFFSFFLSVTLPLFLGVAHKSRHLRERVMWLWGSILDPIQT